MLYSYIALFLLTVTSMSEQEVSVALFAFGIATLLTASMIDNETTRDFISLLPLMLQMNNLFKREKYAHLPRDISEGDGRQTTYEIGDVVYWAPGPDVAIFYRHDGSVEVTIELQG